MIYDAHLQVRSPFAMTVRSMPQPSCCERAHNPTQLLAVRIRVGRAKDYEILSEAYALLVEVIDADLLPIGFQYPDYPGAFDGEACQVLYGFITEVRDRCRSEQSQLRMSSMRSRFRLGIGKGFAYEFSHGDLERVQTLVNELREHIASAKQLEQEHRQRLLRRLERLQTELHKKVSDLDRFWGLIGDAGVVLGKLGNDAKPIVDRIRDIADIVWQTQSRAEELPSGTTLPQLEHKPPPSSEA